MRDIKYTHILNSYVSTEGSGGIMTNYIYYSLLIVYSDGTREIVNGKGDQIQPLLRYVRTQQDELEELKETVKGLRRDINEIVDEKMKKVMDTIYPIPDISGANELDAIERITQAGLTPNQIFEYPETTPRTGIVRSYRRNENNYKVVDLEIIHEIPDLKGLRLEEAIQLLHENGMTENVDYTVVSDGENGTVLSYFRTRDASLEVVLKVASFIPDTKDMKKEAAVALLEQNGFKCYSITERLDQGEPGTVLSWSQVSEKEISLVVRTPAEIICKKVDVKANTLSDSTGDHYAVTASYSNSFKVITFVIKAVTGSKVKRRISSIWGTVDSRQADIKLRSFLPVLEPGSEQEISFTIPQDDGRALPREMEIQFETQYGIMKKTENIVLNLNLNW